ncbi:hypothetical protein LPJ61_003045 [Coemansia biformis]|uniref:YbaK/aminoacyl-tRNA synthetase-associated domain-containing protein n=1 Tax=Coemansia biformis TaxID=1286918 RepID=A0A9W8CY29_9FUNG|nr:hypothetical protein LPJ61_003045 [Coemansia biformis]
MDIDTQTGALLAVGEGISQLLASEPVCVQYMAHFIAAAQRERQDEGRSAWPEAVQRVISGLQARSLEGVSRIYHVSSDYYSWPLYQRALCMRAPSKHHLCKLVVMENKRWRPTASANGWENAQYYCVIVQYVHSINTGAMADFVRSLDGNKVAKKHFNFRLTDASTTLELTGFGKNGVSPIGMTHELPIVLCAAIMRLSPPVLWLGAGHVDFKLALPVQDFVDKTQCLIADISAPNSDGEQATPPDA